MQAFNQKRSVHIVYMYMYNIRYMLKWDMQMPQKWNFIFVIPYNTPNRAGRLLHVRRKHIEGYF